jgi:hypothetical protein
MHYPLLLVDCPVSAAVAVGVGQQGQEAGALDSGGQLTLITSFGTGDTAWNDFAGLGYVSFQVLRSL